MTDAEVKSSSPQDYKDSVLSLAPTGPMIGMTIIKKYGSEENGNSAYRILPD